MTSPTWQPRGIPTHHQPDTAIRRHVQRQETPPTSAGDTHAQSSPKGQICTEAHNHYVWGQASKAQEEGSKRELLLLAKVRRL